MADQTNSPFSHVREFAEAIAMLNTATTQQITNVLQVAALAMQLQKMNDMDMSQAIIESKMAQQLNTQERVRRMFPTTNEAQK